MGSGFGIRSAPERKTTARGSVGRGWVSICLDVKLYLQRLASIVNDKPLRMSILIAFMYAVEVELVALGSYVEYYLMILNDDHAHLASQPSDTSHCLPDV